MRRVRENPRGPRARAFAASEWLGASGIVLSACGGGGEPRPVRQGPLPSEDRVVKVSAGAVQVGFAIGVIRETKNVDAFVISKFPVTRGEYLACVAAGGCKAATGPRCMERPGASVIERPTVPNQELAADVPATCVGRAEAEQYCGWLGAELPALEQWMLVARGSSVTRYSWGTKVPNCEQHPFGVFRPPTEAAKTATALGISAPAVESCLRRAEAPFSTGKHEAGASPLGLHDVLLTRGELVRPSPNAVFTACMPAAPGVEGTASGACVVHGLLPGAIDSVRRLARAKDATTAEGDVGELSPVPYGFRCAWGEDEFR